jgi:hypothetical protein
VAPGKEVVMTTQQFVLPAPYARRIPDPVHGDSMGMVRHILFVPVGSVPEGIPLDANARTPNINRSVYREIERHLLEEEGEPGTFHLKNRGIVMIADKVEQKGEDTYAVVVSKGQGILDGGHTYRLITENGKGEVDLPQDQWVKFEIVTHVPPGWVAELAGGLNTSIQVKAMSLDDLAGRFEWIKDELKNEPYYSRIAFRENELGDVDARDIVAFLTMFNIDRFPNNEDAQPVESYSSKAKVLEWFEKDQKQYKRLRPILKDLLVLYDTMRFESRDHWNETGGKYGNLAFVEGRKRGEFSFPFIERTHKFRLTNGALYPMLASFRWLVDNGPNGEVQWRGGFDAVLKLWRSSAEELLRSVNQASVELGRNPNAVGKSKNLWANLHRTVAMRDLMAQRAKTN